MSIAGVDREAVDLAVSAGLAAWEDQNLRVYGYDKEQENKATARKDKGRVMALARWGHAASIAASNPPSNACSNAEERRGEEKRGEDPPLPPNGGKVKTKRKKSPPAEGSPAFEAFWAEYPSHRRNMGKPAAIAKWPGDEYSEAIMAHLSASKASQDWQKEGGEFVIGIRRYLNEAAWKTPVSDRKPSARQQAPQQAPFFWPKA